MASPAWRPFRSHRPPPYPYKQQSREMMLPSLEAPVLITANPGINLITRSSPRGWGSEAPRGITSCPRLLGRLVLLACWPFSGSPALRPSPAPSRRPTLLSFFPCRALALGVQVSGCLAPGNVQPSVGTGSSVAGEAYLGLAGGSRESCELWDWQAWGWTSEKAPQPDLGEVGRGRLVEPSVRPPSRLPFCLPWVKSLSDPWLVCSVARESA